jgi:hypothetical protein
MDEIDFNSVKLTSDYNLFGKYTIITPPKASWKCELHKGIFWNCEEGKQPNAFHRFMQRLFFGVKWSRVDD